VNPQQKVRIVGAERPARRRLGVLDAAMDRSNATRRGTSLADAAERAWNW
jgi:hypothetical protein